MLNGASRWQAECKHEETQNGRNAKTGHFPFPLWNLLVLPRYDQGDDTLQHVELLLLAGTLLDRIGARRALGVGLIVFTMSSIACGLAPTLGLLIAARFVQGVGDKVPNAAEQLGRCRKRLLGHGPAFPCPEIQIEYCPAGRSLQ